jgi:uncharacterized protein with HEPN domain
MAKGKSVNDISIDRMLNLSLVKLIEIIGEAASRVSLDGQTKHAEIPWGKIIGMRHCLVHGYSDVDFEVLYQTIYEDIPPLIAALEKIVPPDTEK